MSHAHDVMNLTCTDLSFTIEDSGLVNAGVVYLNGTTPWAMSVPLMTPAANLYFVGGSDPDNILPLYDAAGDPLLKTLVAPPADTIMWLEHEELEGLLYFGVYPSVNQTAPRLIQLATRVMGPRR